MSPDELFKQLYERYVDEVYAFCVRRVGRADADDATADVFAVVWRRLSESMPEPSRSWIYGIARNVVRNRWRSSKRRERLAGRVRGLRYEQPDQPESVVLGRSEGEPVRKALGRLRRTDREILMLSAWDGLSGPEIADVLGITPNAVQQRMHRAKKRLAREMERSRTSLAGGMATEEGPA